MNRNTLTHKLSRFRRAKTNLGSCAAHLTASLAEFLHSMVHLHRERGVLDNFQAIAATEEEMLALMNKTMKAISEAEARLADKIRDIEKQITEGGT